MSGRISFGPSAQFMPTLRSGTCEMEFQNASTVWPVTPRLLPAWMNVTEARIGIAVWIGSDSAPLRRRGLEPAFIKNLLDGKKRRLAHSACRKWFPPAACPRRRPAGREPVRRRRPPVRRMCVPRAPGLLTSVEMDEVLVVGPIEPATKQMRPGCAAFTASAARRAHSAPALDNSYASVSSP